MRSGKRLLAGAAAGALAAGFMTFVALPSAQAGTATTIAFEFPSVTAISAANSTGLPVGIELYDSSGDDATALPSNSELRVSVTKPSGATAQADDTFVGFAYAGDDDTTVLDDTSGYADVSIKLGAVYNSGSMNWDTATGKGYVGTYTISACFYNSASGACTGTQTMDFTLVAAAGAPAASVSYLNSSYNPIGVLGVSADDSVQATPNFQLYITDAKGGPYVMDTGLVDVTASTGTTATLTQATGYGAAVLGTYGVTAAAGSDWGSAGSRTISADVTPSGSTSVGSGDLSVKVASINDTPNDITAALTNAVYYNNGTDDTYEVPPGTTDLSFSVSTNDAFNSPSTIAWNTTATATTGVVTPAGGAAAVDASTGTASVTVNSAAATNGEVVRMAFGSYQPSALGDDSTYTVNVAFTAPRVTVSGSNGLAKVGTETTIPGTVLDQYGSTVPGTYGIKAYVGDVACTVTTTPAATATADSAGDFSVVIPASLVPSSPTTGQVYTLCANNGFGSSVKGTATWTYTASGGANSLALVSSPTNSSTSYPLVRVPADGIVNLTTATSATVAYNATAQAIATAVNSSSTIARTGITLTATVSPVGVPVVFSSDDALFVKGVSGSAYASAGSNSVSVTSDGSGDAKATVFATKPGTFTVTAAVGDTTQTMKFTAAVAAGSGRQIAISPDQKVMTPNSFSTFTATVTDIYGNVVPDDTQAITLALNGGGTINPAASATKGTSLAGTLDVTYTAPAGVGSAAIVVSGNNFQDGTIAGAPALIDEATATITVSSGPDPGEKTIVIVGERGTVKGKPGVLVDGVTTGFGEGTAMVPHIKFPGQTSYSEGTSRPKTTEVGDFEWQRKTGKKIYIYFSNEDGSVRSDRIIIQAK